MSSAQAAAPAVASAIALDETSRRVFTKIAWRLMPILTTAYILNYLDRTNIAFAALTMRQAIGLSQTQLGIGAGIFFLGYCLLEIPSNMVLFRVGARRWIARIMVTWGLASAAMAFAVGPYSFYFFRLLLGAAEAGFFPGVAFYLASWFPREFRTRIIAWFMVAIPISTVIGGSLSSALLALDGTMGLAGWQWLFIVEGLPAVVVGGMLLSRMTERPEDATWLSDEEKRVVATRLATEHKPKEVRHFGRAFRDARVLILGGIQFGFLVGSYGIGIFLPQILNTGTLSNLQIGFVTSACYAVASVTMVVWAGYVDRHENRVGNLARACLVAAVGFAGSIVFRNNLLLSIVALTVAVSGVNAARALFWTIPPRFLSGMAAAGGLAFINSIGTSGGFVGPYIMGWLADRTGSFTAGQMALSGFLLAAAGLAWWLKSFEAE
jgi:ACS family tartrate transporter-like MFS transporter